MSEYKNVKTTQEELGHEKRVATFKISQILWWLLGVLEGLLALRFLFKLIGVNPINVFASFIYNLTNIFVKPFVNLTGAPSAGNMILEITTLIAMLVYALLFWAMVELVNVIFYRPRGAVKISQTIISQQTTPQVPTSNNELSITEETNIHKTDSLD